MEGNIDIPLTERRKNAIHLIENWFNDKGWKPHTFQKNTWKKYLAQNNGLLNAPTGSGKTYALGGAAIAEYLSSSKPENKNLQVIWITPIRALAQEIKQSLEKIIHDLDIPWEVGIRNGDTPTAVRQKLKRTPPQILITTPESLHLLLASKGYKKYFKHLKLFVCDEWHELFGSKRGVQIELALSLLSNICSKLKVWGISATIGNLDQSKQALLGYQNKKSVTITANLHKKIEITPIIPAKNETLPWGGHLGITLVNSLIPIIKKSKTTLIFTNTRSQCEIWYSKILDTQPDLAGVIAMHHGSIDKKLRVWVEDALHHEKLKAVVCTSSLDLGVDFRPVETVVQIGSPKGVARFLQRAGRSNHRPRETSNIYFLPTNSLELLESSALKKAITKKQVEDRTPHIRSFDVLLQYLTTLAVSDGFYPDEIYNQIKQTFCYSSISREEFDWCLHFLVNGGDALQNYDEYKKVEISENGLYKLTSRRLAMRHRLSIGTIVGDNIMRVKFQKGGTIGTIEEYFITRLNKGDVFQFAGRVLEFIRIEYMDVIVKKAKAKNALVPAWQGGRMPLSSQLSSLIRDKINEIAKGNFINKEDKFLAPLFEKQKEKSIIPKHNQLLIEKIKSREGYHLFIYPFEGYLVHEGLAPLLAYRISKLSPISFSLSYTDYGIELLADREIDINESIVRKIFSLENLYQDIQQSINSAELAKRKFRDIATISGLIFKGMPGKEKRSKHIQASSSLLFDVLNDYSSNNLLVKQAYDEVFLFELEENRLRLLLERIEKMEVIITQPQKFTPLAFPITVERIKGKLSSEKLADRIKRMQIQHD